MSPEKQLTRRIVPFYLGEQRDSQGRMIQELWAWDFEELECTHDYIQWLFPLPEKSAFNPDAPIVNNEVIQAFQNNPNLRQNILRSFTVMLRFYGLHRQESSEGKVVITQSEDYPNRKREWVCPFDHNYLRITRILKCLVAFGLEDEAQAFYECLRQIYRESSDCIGGETFQYWTNAAIPPAPAEQSPCTPTDHRELIGFGPGEYKADLERTVSGFLLLSEIVDVFVSFFSISELKQIHNGARNAISVSVRGVEEYFENGLELSNLVTQLKAYSSLIILKIEEHIDRLEELEQSSKVKVETSPAISSNKQLRPFGLCAGEFIVPDDFDAPLPEEILNAFEGK